MKVIVKIEDDVPSGKALATIEVVAESEKEIEANLKRKDGWLAVLIAMLGLSRVVIPKLIQVSVPALIKIITKETLKGRFDFLGLSEKERALMLLLCQGVSRKDSAIALFVGRECIKSHYTNVKQLIGNYKDDELKTIFTCTHEYYLAEYYERIEDYKMSKNCNYKKKKFT